jgi:hypothetical protein
MRIRWMYRAMLSSNPTKRGVLYCYEEEPKHSKELAALLKFVPDEPGAKHIDIWVHNPGEPVIREDVNYNGVVFRAYAKMEVSPDTSKVEPVTKVTVKMPVRTS